MTSRDVTPGPPSGTRAFVAMGSNLGDRWMSLQSALDRMADIPGTAPVQVSPVYRSAAHVLRPSETQPDYYNAAVEVRTTLQADQLMDQLLEIENRYGRQREPDRRWAPRTLDLDMLLFGSQTIERPGLTVPHPRLRERRFVLQPLADLDPGLFIPEPVACFIGPLLDACPDIGLLRRLESRLRLPSTRFAP